MNRRGAVGSALGAAVLALFFLRGPAPGPGTPSASTQATQPPRISAKRQGNAKPSEKTRPEDGPWKASQQHFAGLEQNECPAPAALPASRQIGSLNGMTLVLQQGTGGTVALNDLRKELWCIPADNSVQAMIAIAPDPVHTHLSLGFDRTIEALQLAAAATGYVFDRYWLPWDTELRPQFTDYDSQTRATEEQEEKENQPGLLLFRWNGDANALQPKILYVFLVVDTSTTGVNANQFQNAVTYVQEVCGKTSQGKPGCGDWDGRVRLMGPTFSGSLASLRQLTDRMAPDFTIYSGTVSSSTAIANQHWEKDTQTTPSTQAVKTKEHVTFRTFVSSTESSLNAFVAFLQETGQIDCEEKDDPQVAILSEAATSYGQAGSGENIKKRTDTEVTDTQTCKVTTYRYPREISSLRNAYQTSATGASSAGDNTRAYLPLNLAEHLSNKSDEPPDFSQEQGPLSKEAVLMKFASEMRREHYRYIGVSGSNVLDVLFLSNFLRKAVPDARVFVPSADLLFERDIDNASYIGSLAVSTYPLISENFDWLWPRPLTAPDRLPFSDQFTEGQYNAALRAMSELIDGKGPGGKDLSFYECQAPFANQTGCPPINGELPKSLDPTTSKLPIWLGVVGTGGYWPVKILSPKTAPHKLEADDFSLVWKGAVLLLSILGIGHVWVLLTRSPVTRHLRDFLMTLEIAGQRLFFIHVSCACLALGLGMLLVPWFRNGSGSQPALFLLLVLLALAAVVALILTAAWLAVTNWLRWKHAKTKVGHKFWFVTGTALVWVLALLVFYFWCGLFAPEQPGSYGLFFAYRTMHLESGVSPAAPLLLLLALIYLWSIFETWRLGFNEQLRPRLAGSGSPPAGTQPPTLPLPGMRSEMFVTRAISSYLLKGSYVVAFLIVFFVWLLFFNPIHPFELFESQWFGRLCSLFFLLAVAIMLSTGFRFGQIWSELRELLFELERSPMRLAFRHLKEANWAPIWRQGGPEAEWINMARSLEAARQIKNCHGKESCEALEKQIEKIEDQIEDIRKVYQRLLQRGRLWRRHDGERNLPSTIRLGLEYMGFYKSSESEKLSKDFDDFQEYFCNIQTGLAEILNEIWPKLDRHWSEDCLKHEELEDLEDRRKAEDCQDSHKPVIVYCTAAESDRREKEEKEEKEKKEKKQLMERMQEYAAHRYVAFIRGALAHMKRSLLFVGIAFSLVLIALNIYSFEPHQSLIWSLTVIFIVVAFTVVSSLMQLHRDRILSLISGSKPNELGLEFYVRVVAYGAVPLLTLLATHFPSIGKFLVSFLQPGLEALK